MDPLTAEIVLPKLKTRWLGRTYRHFPELPSTNVWLRDHADAQALPPGTVVLTEHQTAGKGRLGRHWVAPPESALLHSILLRPGWPAEQANWLTMMAGLAAAEAAEQVTGLRVQLKWPNDVVVEREGVVYKWGGILPEGDVQHGRLQTAVVGIGLNVNMSAADLPAAPTPATSLMIETGGSVSRLDVLVTLLQAFENHYEAAQNGVSPHLRWKERLVTLGKRVQVSLMDQGTTVVGMAEDTDVQGHLRVRDANGVLHTLTTGDVTLRA